MMPAAETAKKYSLVAQITEINRELALRERVYPSQVTSGRMRQSEAEYHIEVLKRVRATLNWLQSNELLIKQRLSY